MFGLSINSPLDSDQQSRLDCSEFRRCMGRYVSRSNVAVILRQPCGSSSSAPPMYFASGARRLGTDQCNGTTLLALRCQAAVIRRTKRIRVSE